MSMTLILWKAPLVDDADEAKALLETWYETSDDSAFELSSELALVYDELLRRYPMDWEKGADPWADGPDNTGRLLVLSISWSGDNAILDDVVALTRKHELVLYDPQGPDLHLPGDPEDPPGPPEPLGFGAIAMGFGVTLLGVLLIAGGWLLSVPVLNWLLIVFGLFVLGVGFTLLYAFIIEPRRQPPER
jgi:hypothetical protein